MRHAPWYSPVDCCLCVLGDGNCVPLASRGSGPAVTAGTVLVSITEHQPMARYQVSHIRAQSPASRTSCAWVHFNANRRVGSGDSLLGVIGIHKFRKGTRMGKRK